MSWLPRKLVVVPVDFSENSLGALETAIELANTPDTIFAVHIVPHVAAISPGMIWDTVNDATRVNSTKKYFRDFLVDRGLDKINLEVRVGDPGLQITDFSREIGADLIVISSHGYHGMKRLLMGSVAERVLRHADCPVLVLRRNDPAAV
ncbi:MAG: universal stress protein UspA [Planctomycetaceae bacterium]|jgi:nucleotide-binding universal stress UspA family protein|nr:universal stress protein UspA [Planctomycetaceae bacterium]MDP7277170.1 universal stress protein [Planctomycetaceae bacterium]